MQEIGQLLQELRIKKGLSIEDIQEITKIRSRYIQAIEEGNLEKLPGQFYAKAFIRTYAEVVELDPEIVKEYQEKLPTPEFNNVHVKPRFQSSNHSSTKISKWLIVSLVYILIALVILSVYIFYVSYSQDDKDDLLGDPIDQRLEVDDTSKNDKKPNDQGTDTADDPSKADDEQKAEEQKEQIQITRISAEAIGSRPHDIFEVVVPDGEEIKVQLKFKGKCWFDIRDNSSKGKQLLTATLDTGQETDVFVVNDRLWILLGNASGADIYINDQKFAAGDIQSPKYITIKKAE